MAMGPRETTGIMLICHVCESFVRDDFGFDLICCDIKSKDNWKSTKINI